MKKIISLILAVLLISALVPTFALADLAADIDDLLHAIDDHDQFGSGGVQALLNSVFSFIENFFGQFGSIINGIWKIVESVKFPTVTVG